MSFLVTQFHYLFFINNLNIGNTPLHEACVNNEETLVKDLIDNGGNVDVVNNVGESVTDKCCYEFCLKQNCRDKCKLTQGKNSVIIII